MKISVLIPAAGSGSRFKQKRSKLEASLNGKPVIGYSLEAFRAVKGVREIVIATQPGFKMFLSAQVRALKLPFPVKIVKGGKTRAESVYRALKSASKKSDHVLIHDGARPLVKPEWIRKLISGMNGSDGAVLGRSAVPTIKRFNPESGEILETVNRQTLFEAETPQFFKKDALERAYQALDGRAYGATDDASLIELAGGDVKAVCHDGSNLKITTTADLELAENMLATSKETFRFGLGLDRHRLAAGRAFYLGGVKLKADFGPVGHSDGDPLLHAIIDGMLGALGLGDIGDFFPDSSSRYKNIKSTLLAKRALKLIQSKGFSVYQIDGTVILDRPKLGMHKKEICANLSKIFNLPLSKVSCKAKTSEGLGPEKMNQAVSAEALVVLQPRGVL